VQAATFILQLLILTKNKMYVTETSIGTHNMDAQTVQAEMMRHHQDGMGVNPVDQLRAILGLCNSGEFDVATEKLSLNDRRIIGDATDQALLRLSESLGPVSELRRMWKTTFELAFNSKNKYMIRTLALVENKGLKIALPAAEAEAFHPDDT
jgi:sodium/potassium-transporting ATPase subunit alpha